MGPGGGAAVTRPSGHGIGLLTGKVTITIQIFAAVLFSVRVAGSCTVIAPTLKQPVKHADAVFRGTISEYRDTGQGYKIAVFQVSRVWKGRVGQIVEMSTDPGYRNCTCAVYSDKLLDVGSDEIVFASRVKGQSYLTNYWCGTTSAKSYPDLLHKLGPGKPPREIR